MKHENNEMGGFGKIILHPLKFRVFLAAKLPAALLAGIRVRSFASDSCAVSVPMKWFNTNPFRSIYFACLAMAAEMSTGALAMQGIYKKSPPVSMLITEMKAIYHKKATGKVLFTCNEGKEITQAINQAREGSAQTISVYTEGRNAEGVLIASFWFTWSFKLKGE